MFVHTWYPINSVQCEIPDVYVHVFWPSSMLITEVVLYHHVMVPFQE